MRPANEAVEAIKAGEAEPLMMQTRPERPTKSIRPMRPLRPLRPMRLMRPTRHDWPTRTIVHKLHHRAYYLLSSMVQLSLARFGFAVYNDAAVVDMNCWHKVPPSHEKIYLMVVDNKKK